MKPVKGPTILLCDGNYFSFERPDLTPVSIEVIAHGLSMICRFAGQAQYFYSVAEHSVHASYNVEPGYEYEALMHDAPESLIGDMTKPLKEICPDYRAIEALVENNLAIDFNFTVPMPPAVKKVDIQMLLTEQIQVMNNNDVWSWGLGHEPLPVKIEGWSPAVAKQKFLERYYELRGMQ